MSGTIQNGANTPLNAQSGSLPQMGGALISWFQPMVFSVVTKQTVGFQVVETMTDVSFRGVIQPAKSRALMMKPEGQQAWTYYTVHADPSLKLNVDDVIRYLTKQYRVLELKDYTQYQYVEYNLVEDYTGSGPTVVP